MTCKSHRRASGLTLPIVAAVVIAACGSAAERPRAEGQDRERATYRVQSDHDTYGTLDALRAKADVIAIGTPLSSEVVPGVSPGDDGAGDPIPGVPHTEYSVRVDESIKAAGDTGSSLVVALPGGATQEGTFVTEGTRKLTIGQDALFFLLRGADGKFYPLAAGTAIGDRQPDGTFAVPAAATGAAALVLTENQARGIDPPPTVDPQPQPQPNPPIVPKPSVATGPLVKVTLVRGQRPSRIFKRGIRLKVTCSEACTLTSRLSITGQLARKYGIKRSSKPVVVARAKAPRARTITLKFTAVAAKRLRNRARLSLAVVVRATGTQGGVTELLKQLVVTRSTMRLR
jgi:hypothetical protein